MSRKEALAKYLHDAKIQELINELSASGYVVLPEHREGGHVFDLVAVRGSEKLYIEVKSGPWAHETKKAITRMAQYVRKIPSARFLVVLAEPPREKTIEVEGLQDVLERKVISDPPAKLAMMSPYTQVKSVSDVDIEAIHVSSERITVRGSATLEVLLQYEPAHENEGEGLIYDAYPMRFDLVLTSELEIQEATIDVDISEFYK